MWISLLNKFLEIGSASNDVVGAVVFDKCSADAENCAFDAAVSRVSENVVAIGANIALTEILG